jgi:hypothetical protein
MSAHHQCLSIDGEALGDLVSVGSRVAFFTVRKELKPLDGRLFASVADLRSAVKAALARRIERHEPQESRATAA